MIMPASTLPNLLSRSNDLLICYVELWLPSVDASRLDRVAARSVPHQARAQSRQAISVVPGEGIAGAAWKQNSAVLLQEDPSDLLKRLGTEFDVRPAAVIALPVFRELEIRGVMVLGINNDFGAAEIWKRDDRDELTITAGHYSGLPSFQFITQYTRFPKGAGVPGAVWQSRRPLVTQNLEQNSGFIRSFGNDPAKVSAAIGLPIGTSAGFAASVLVFLQADCFALSRRTELLSCSIEPATDSSEETIHVTSNVVVGTAEEQSGTEWHRDLAVSIHQSAAPGMIDCDDHPEIDFRIGWPVFVGNELANILSLTF